MLDINKIMFEIYQEKYSSEYKVVYFTELNDHTRETEIGKALSGDHIYDGFIKEFKKDDAKQIIDRLLNQMNDGEELTSEDIETALEDHIPASV
jgi:hypothetical protein